MQQHQTYQTPSWNQVVSDLGALVNPPRCPTCGRAHAQVADAPGGDWLSQWNESPLVKEWNRAWGAMLDPLLQSLKPAAGQPQPHPAHQHHAAHEGKCGCSCGCSRGCSCCQPDDCHCRCCVVNAHLLVRARVGESRVVPITIENSLRREREVELELSDWVSSGKQGVKVTGQVVPETKFTLKPCESRTVAVAVRVTGDASPNIKQSADANEGAGAYAAGAQEASFGRVSLGDLKRERLPDVDACAVFYADLRVKGCDILPVRIAVAILPRDCDAYKIDCRCGCCC